MAIFFSEAGGGGGGGVEGAAQTSRCEAEVNCSDKWEFGRVGLKGKRGEEMAPAVLNIQCHFLYL